MFIYHTVQWNYCGHLWVSLGHTYTHYRGDLNSGLYTKVTFDTLEIVPSIKVISECSD